MTLSRIKIIRAESVYENKDVGKTFDVPQLRARELEALRIAEIIIPILHEEPVILSVTDEKLAVMFGQADQEWKNHTPRKTILGHTWNGKDGLWEPKFISKTYVTKLEQRIVRKIRKKQWKTKEYMLQADCMEA